VGPDRVIYTDLADVPDKTFGVVYLDPPWRFQTYGPQDGNKGRRDAEKHYPTMSISEMKTLDVKRIAKRDSLMMMWTSWPYLEQALDLMRAYGFRYTSSFKVWVKLKRSFSHTKFFVTNPSDFAVGTGYTSRKNVELILLGRRGTPKRLAKDVRELIVSPVREHSRKPDIYADIERYAAGPYLEMFARTMRPGWSQFGNDVQKFIQPEPAVGLALPVEPEPEQMMIWDRPKPKFTVMPGLEAVDDGVEIPAFLKRLVNLDAARESVPEEIVARVKRNRKPENFEAHSYSNRVVKPQADLDYEDEPEEPALAPLRPDEPEYITRARARLAPFDAAAARVLNQRSRP
jgi:N6-adenosine-specific RNA methylase IME4